MRWRCWAILSLGALALVEAPTAVAATRHHLCGVRYPVRAASPWPQMRHDTNNTGLSTIPAAYQGDRPWSFTTGAGLFITPVVDGNGMVYFGSADHNFYALTRGGKLCWKLQTGNIIDAGAALDRSQRTVTIGSADDYLYHLSTKPSARRRVLWRYLATAKPATGQLVDWWEDNIAYGPDGNIYTGNTGGVIYSFTPRGRLRWTFTGAGNSVWTTPAFGPGGTTYWGSVDRNIYALNASGSQSWSRPTVGFVISSPALGWASGPQGQVGTIYVGSFDSNLYALDPTTGLPKWTFGTNDHIYSSPALAHDAQGQTSEIYVASTDGSVYALSPSGKQLWSYDTGEPIRSSPVLGPGPGGRGLILYVGSSDGSLYALDAATGHRRWSYDTVLADPILRDRHELNSSPALSRTGVYIGSEDGHLTYVPYDYCLHRADVRCNTSPGAPYPGDMSRVLPVTSGGVTHLSGGEGPVPASSEITGRLLVRQGGSTVYASMLPNTASPTLVRTDPSFGFSTQLSGDGRFVFITPNSFLNPNTTYKVTVGGTWGANGARIANYTQPGTWTRYGTFGDTFSFRTTPQSGPLPLHMGPRAVTAFELRRLAVPLPAFLPSVNQIGFDSYVLLVAPVAMGPPDSTGQGPILMWAVQARRDRRGRYLADPHGTLVFPLYGYYRGDTLMLTNNNAVLTFSFGTVPLRRLDMDFELTPRLANRPGASLYAEAVCAQIPNYGPAAYLTGLCNAEGILPAAGTFITNAYPASGGANRKPSGISVASVTLQRPTASAGSATATLALRPGTSYPAANHRLSLLLVDDAGSPLGLDYTQQTTTTDSRGNLASVKLTIPAGTNMPNHLKAYVISDVFPLAAQQLY